MIRNNLIKLIFTKRQYAFFFLLVFSFYASYSHVLKTHTIQQVEEVKNKKQSLKSLDSIIKFHFGKRDAAMSLFYLEHYIDLSLQQGKFEEAIDKLDESILVIVHNFRKRTEFEKLIEKCETYSVQITDNRLKGKLYSVRGYFYVFTSKRQKAGIALDKADSLLINDTSKSRAKVLYYRGLGKLQTGNYDQAFNDFNTAGKLYKKLGIMEEYYNTRAYIIDMYYRVGLYHKSAQEREKLIQEKLDGKVFERIPFEYINLANAYRNLENDEKRRESIRAALEFLKNEGETDENLLYRRLVYANLVHIEASANDIDQAKYFLDLLSNSFPSVESRESNPFYKIAESDYLRVNKQYQKAISILKEMMENEYNKGSYQYKNAANIISSIYESMGDFEKALMYSKRYHRIKDSVATLKKSNALSYYESLYEKEKSDLEILRQQEAIEDLENEVRLRKREMVYGFLALFLLFLILFLFRNYTYLKRKNALQTKFSQGLLISQDLERKKISKELRDSVGQRLLLVKNQLPSEYDELKESLDTGIEEMRAISRTLSPIQLQELGITSAIRNLVDVMDESNSDVFFFGNIENIDGLLSKEKELSLYRLIQECFSNVLKHAKAQSTQLKLKKNKENEIEVTIQDNGIGFEFSKKFKDLRSLGLKTIEERVRYLNGTLNVESKQGKGTIYKLLIKTS